MNSVVERKKTRERRNIEDVLGICSPVTAYSVSIIAATTRNAQRHNMPDELLRECRSRH